MRAEENLINDGKFHGGGGGGGEQRVRSSSFAPSIENYSSLLQGDPRAK